MNDDGTIGDLSVMSDEMVYNLDTTGLNPVGSFTNGTYAVAESGSGSQGGGGYVAPTYSTVPSEGDDKIQINIANSTGSVSALIDAAEGLDSLHLDGFSLFTNSSEDLIVDDGDAVLSEMVENYGTDIFSSGATKLHYAEISLGNELSGRVDVWTQTNQYYNGYEPIDTVLGIID